MLRLRKFSLKSNIKRLTGPPSPDRDRQMRLIRRETTRFLNSAQPVISVDAKKSELIGDFDNKGQKWEAEGKAEEVSAYNFPVAVHGFSSFYHQIALSSTDEKE